MANKLQNKRRKRIKQLRAKGKTLKEIGEIIIIEEQPLLVGKNTEPLSVQLVKYYLK